MKNKPIIIGTGDVGRTTLAERYINESLKNNHFIISPPDIHFKNDIHNLQVVKNNQQIIYIDGKKYEKQEIITDNILTYKKIKEVTGLLDVKPERKRPDVDILTEYKLIKNKKSTISRNDREWVVSEFNRLYKEIM